MTQPIIPRDDVAHKLSVSPRVLIRYEEMGLVRSIQTDTVIGYEVGEVRRIWRIVSFQRDLGINLAGIEVILQLHDRISEIHFRVNNLAEQLRELVDQDDLPALTELDVQS